MKIKNPTTLKDALFNMDEHSGASLDYATGLAVGVVSTLMAMGYTYHDAIAQLAIHMPSETSKPRYTVPESWREGLVAARLAIEPPFQRKTAPMVNYKGGQ